MRLHILLLTAILMTGCLIGTQKPPEYEFFYVCPDGTSVADPELCPKGEQTAVITTEPPATTSTTISSESPTTTEPEVHLTTTTTMEVVDTIISVKKTGRPCVSGEEFRSESDEDVYYICVLSELLETKCRYGVKRVDTHLYCKEIGE